MLKVFAILILFSLIICRYIISNKYDIVYCFSKLSYIGFHKDNECYFIIQNNHSIKKHLNNTHYNLGVNCNQNCSKCEFYPQRYGECDGRYTSYITSETLPSHDKEGFYLQLYSNEEDCKNNKPPYNTLLYLKKTCINVERELFSNEYFWINDTYGGVRQRYSNRNCRSNGRIVDWFKPYCVKSNMGSTWQKAFVKK
jgi:hypothetical protein